MCTAEQYCIEQGDAFECVCRNGCDIDSSDDSCSTPTRTNASKNRCSRCDPVGVSMAEPPTCTTYGVDGCQLTGPCNITGCGIDEFVCPCIDGFEGLDCRDGEAEASSLPMPCTRSLNASDIPECTRGLDECGNNTNCIDDPPGSYTCECLDGYEEDLDNTNGKLLNCSESTCTGAASLPVI